MIARHRKQNSILGNHTKMADKYLKHGAAVETDSDDDCVDDEDTCDLAEIKRLFTTEYTATLQENVSLKESYILHLSANNEFDKIAIGTSTGQISMFDLQTSAMTTTNSCLYDEHFENPISGLKFFNGDSNLIVAAAEDGIIKMYDLRTNQKICSLEDSTDGKRKTVTSMDLNQNNRVLCAGTDKIQSDVYLLFFDLRERVLMGAYADSHSDDITNVRFHPENPDSLASCSTDGLINVFDISQASEDDAFMYCMNTESSAAVVNWHKEVASKKDLLTCITHTHDLHLYDVEEQELLVEFARDKVTQAVKRKSVADCNLINCHNEKDGTMFVLATSNFNKGECVRSVKVEDKQLIPHGNYVGNLQILRTSLYDANNGLMVTGGENGIISVWKKQEIALKSDGRSFKEKSNVATKLHEKRKPY